jgi:hypothetical protein
VFHQLLQHNNTTDGEITDVAHTTQESTDEQLIPVPTARKLVFDNVSVSQENIGDESACMLLEAEKNAVNSSAPKERGRGKQAVSAMVDTNAGVRKSVRQAMLKKGYKEEPHKEEPTPKKKPKCKPMKEKSKKENQEKDVPPITPVKILQKVGEALGILADELTEEKLMAAPDNVLPKMG